MKRVAKRKATEIVDSEAEDESDNGDVTALNEVSAPGHSAARNALIKQFGAEDEMLLDTHGKSLVDGRHPP